MPTAAGGGFSLDVERQSMESKKGLEQDISTTGRFTQTGSYPETMARTNNYINNIKELAKATGLDSVGLSKAVTDPKIRFLLKKDIIDGLKLGVSGTPSFVIDGQVYQGQIPPEILKQVMN